jgi:uncharacterized protein (DUF305 family)
MARDKNEDRAFIRRMSAHHAQGIEIAKLGAAQGLDPHLRALARLIAAEQIGERRIFDRWWRSWFDDPPEGCSGSERAEMPGMLQPDWIERLHAAQGSMFDRLFVSAMTYHHRGAVTMAEDELHSGGDARLRTMAWAIRHGQQGEIEMMRGTTGLDAVKAAIGNMISARLAIGDRRAPQ